MADSIFTRIINGEIPCYKLYEDEHTFVFLDIHPAQPGHTLVIPKVQIDHLWDVPDAEYEALMATAKRVAQHLRNKLPVARIGMKVIGLDVPHAHIHLIPFSTHEEIQTQPDLQADPDHAALKTMAEKLKM